MITIIEGESLVNDASALIAYRYAVTAVTTGTFIFWQAGLQFLLVASVGIMIGMAIGYLFVFAHKKIENNPIVETSLTLLAPYISFLIAEHFHMSGVLAVVSTGLVISWRAPEVFSYQTRMNTRVVWDTAIFLLHGFVFILIGLQLPLIINDLGHFPVLLILGYGLVISLITIVVRIVWVFAGAYGQKYFHRLKSSADKISENVNTDDTWKNVLVVAWTGTRGVISLAAALALPFVLQDGSAFPKRYSIIILAFVVIFVTLVVQGLSLPYLIRWLNIKPDDNTNVEEFELQLYLANSTVHFIEHDFPLPISRQFQQQLKKKYELLIQDHTKELKRHKKAKRNDVVAEINLPDPLLNLQLEINKFQRALLLVLHKEGQFSDAVIRKLESDMDVDDLKLDQLLPNEEKIVSS